MTQANNSSSHLKTYMDLHARAKAGQEVDANKELADSGYEKSGKFCEKVIEEIAAKCGLVYKTDCEVPRQGLLTKKGRTKQYRPDGYLEELGLYIESKNFAFGSSGTASEKLLYAISKAARSDKKVVIVFGGRHDLLDTEVDEEIWNAWHHAAGSGNAIVDGMMKSVDVRNVIEDIVKLSELEDWLLKKKKATTQEPQVSFPA